MDVDGIKVRTLGVSYNQKMGVNDRIRSFLVFAGRSMGRATRARNCDVVLATSTPLTVALPALVARWGARCPVVFEVRDVWPDAAVDAGVLRNPALIRLAKMLEMMIYKHSDHIVTLSTGMSSRIKSKGNFGEKITMIPNCCDLDRFGPNVDGLNLRRQQEAENKFVVLYVGAIGRANNVEYLVEVVEQMRYEPDIVFWFVGDGNRLDFLKRKVESRGMGNVHIFGPQPKSAVPRFMAAADVGLVTFIPQPVYYENSPNKFFDYIAAGLPVIFNRSTWLKPYISSHAAGIVCEENRPTEMVDAIRQLKSNPGLQTAMRRNARGLAEKEFSRDVMSDRYVELLQRVSSGLV